MITPKHLSYAAGCVVGGLGDIMCSISAVLVITFKPEAWPVALGLWILGMLMGIFVLVPCGDKLERDS